MLVAIDTGGTKTLVTQFNQDGSIATSIKFPTPPDQNDYVSLLKETVQKNFHDQPVEAIVIALPGIVKDGVALWCNNLKWKDFDAHGAFADILGNTPIYIENDANLAGLAETRVLDPMPPSSLYVTISTGIGTGIITNGRIDPGLRHSEGGRMLVEFDGKLQEWEKFASGKAIYERYSKFARDITSAEDWHEIATRISRGFLAAIPLIQPDVVIMGGSIGTYYERYNNELTRILQQELPSHIPTPHFIKAKHPEQAVVFGCYYYALDILAR